MDNFKRAASAYKSVQVDAAVLGASPHELVAKLLSRAIESIHAAKHLMAEGNVKAKGEQIKLAMAIVSDGLLGSLNLEEGGEIAANLAVLYEYMLEQLLKAHAENDPALLDEVASLLGEVKQGWDGIKPGQGQAAQAELQTQP